MLGQHSSAHSWIRLRFIATITIALSALAVTTAHAQRGGGPARGRGLGPMAAQVTPILREGPACALDATIYDVRVPADQIGRIDVAALTRGAGSAADFDKVLAALGPARPIYRLMQSVRLSGESITIGQTMPYVTGSTGGRNGQVTNTVNFSNVGGLIDLVGKAIAPDRMDVDVHLQVSSLADSSVGISAAVKAPIFRTVAVSRSGIVDANKPFVVLAVDAGSLDENGKAAVYIARITIGAPQSSATPVRGE